MNKNKTKIFAKDFKYNQNKFKCWGLGKTSNQSIQCSEKGKTLVDGSHLTLLHNKPMILLLALGLTILVAKRCAINSYCIEQKFTWNSPKTSLRGDFNLRGLIVGRLQQQSSYAPVCHEHHNMWLSDDIWTRFRFNITENKMLCHWCGQLSLQKHLNLKWHLQGSHPEIHAQVILSWLSKSCYLC